MDQATQQHIEVLTRELQHLKEAFNVITATKPKLLSVTTYPISSVPMFCGKPEELDDWVFRIESWFKINECPEELKVHLGTTRLDKEAAAWWRNILKEGMIYDTWEDLKQVLLTKYCTESCKREAFRQLRLTLFQDKSMTVSEYSCKFNHVIGLIGLSLPESWKILFFIDGLRTDIAGHVWNSKPETLSKAMDVASSLGQNLTPQRPIKLSLRTDDERVMEIDMIQTTSQKLSNYEKDKLTKTGGCFRCRQPGHIARNCPKNQPIQGKCFYCGKTGHNARNCLLRTRRINEIDTIQGEENFQTEQLKEITQ